MTCRKCGRDAIVGRSLQATETCIHRSDAVGIADCGCGGNPKVYACGIHGFAMDRKLKPGRVPVVIDHGKHNVNMTYCNACPQKLAVPRTLPVQHAAIITPHYNPAGFARLNATLQEWLPTMPDGVTIENGDGGPENIMWQKERLINRAIERIDPAIRYVCWCDHDICFERSDWLIEACRMIDAGTMAVQPFETVQYQGRDGLVETTAKGAAFVASNGGTPSTGPGACWVASRKWLDSIGGLYDRNIVGGGDAVFFEAVSGQRTKYRDRQPPASQRHLGEWVDRVGPVAIGYVAGSVRHLWHGDRANRQYVSRDAIMCRWQFDPDVHVAVDDAGLLAWTDAAPQGLRDDVAGYFAGRREDG